MTGHQPAPGEFVGFMVTAGDARNSGVVSVQERSNLVAIPFPSSGAVYMPKARPDPVPEPDPVPPPPTPTDGLDELRRDLAELTRKVDALLARSAPVYRGTLPGVPALGVPAGTVVLKPEVEGASRGWGGWAAGAGCILRDGSVPSGTMNAKEAP